MSPEISNVISGPTTEKTGIEKSNGGNHKSLSMFQSADIYSQDHY